MEKWAESKARLALIIIRCVRVWDSGDYCALAEALWGWIRLPGASADYATRTEVTCSSSTAITVEACKPVPVIAVHADRITAKCAVTKARFLRMLLELTAISRGCWRSADWLCARNHDRLYDDTSYQEEELEMEMPPVSLPPVIDMADAATRTLIGAMMDANLAGAKRVWEDFSQYRSRCDSSVYDLCQKPGPDGDAVRSWYISLWTKRKMDIPARSRILKNAAMAACERDDCAIFGQILAESPSVLEPMENAQFWLERAADAGSPGVLRLLLNWMSESPHGTVDWGLLVRSLCASAKPGAVDMLRLLRDRGGASAVESLTSTEMRICWQADNPDAADCLLPDDAFPAIEAAHYLHTMGRNCTGECRLKMVSWVVKRFWLRAADLCRCATCAIAFSWLAEVDGAEEPTAKRRRKDSP